MYNIETTALSFHNMHEHGSLFVNLLKARRQSFIVKNKWALPEADGLEYDQYDNPSSRWIAVHVGEQVLAGIRLTPTTARCGMYSYMIRDAQLGLLPTIPSNLLYFKAPVEEGIWESSRIFVSQDVPSHLRTVVQEKVMTSLIKLAEENGARQLLGLVPAVWSRWIGRLGLRAEAAGPVLEMENWRTQVALMHLNPLSKAQDEIGTARHTRTEFQAPGIIQRARLKKNRRPAA
jgi:N-acyl-L-homoserine lactone synthetase